MKGRSDMLLLVVSLLCWIKAEGVCSQAGVNTSGDMKISPGEAFSLSCTFTCLTTRHAAQLWRDKKVLVNISSSQPDVTLALNIKSFTKADTGLYQCKTDPPNTISPYFSITMTEGKPEGEPSSAAEVNTDNFTRKAPSSTTASNLKCNCTQQTHSAAGLNGQMWFWMLLGKTIILLLSLASLAVKYKTG